LLDLQGPKLRLGTFAKGPGASSGATSALYHAVLQMVGNPVLRHRAQDVRRIGR
jgi:pyruvate kinase